MQSAGSQEGSEPRSLDELAELADEAAAIHDGEGSEGDEGEGDDEESDDGSDGSSEDADPDDAHEEKVDELVKAFDGGAEGGYLITVAH